jgi:hypothetical protein
MLNMRLLLIIVSSRSVYASFVYTLYKFNIVSSHINDWGFRHGSVYDNAVRNFVAKYGTVYE